MTALIVDKLTVKRGNATLLDGLSLSLGQGRSSALSDVPEDRLVWCSWWWRKFEGGTFGRQ